MDKFAKKRVCGYCEKEMGATYRSKKFCSDKCRVYFGRGEKSISLKLATETNFGQVPTILEDTPKHQVIPIEQGNGENIFSETKEDKINKLEGELALITGTSFLATQRRRYLKNQIEILK